MEATAARAGAAAEPRPEVACECIQPRGGVVRISRYRAPLNRTAVCGSKYSPPWEDDLGWATAHNEVVLPFLEDAAA